MDRETLASRAAAILDELRSAAAVDPVVEEEFNRQCDQKHLDVQMHRGRLYRKNYGESHTARLAG